MKKPRKKEVKVKYGTISLPLPLIEKVQKRIKGTGMPSVSSFVAFILRQVLSSPQQDNKSSVLDKEEEFELTRRLKALGY